MSLIRFREEQQFTQWWIWAGVLVGAAGAASGVVEIVRDGRGGAWPAAVALALLAIGLPVLFRFARLVVEVHDDRIVVRYRPFTTRTIRFEDISSVESVTYRPIREYGGWGIKGWTRRKVAYNMKGSRGVLVGAGDRRTILLGSQRPDALAAAIIDAMAVRKP